MSQDAVGVELGFGGVVGDSDFTSVLQMLQMLRVSAASAAALRTRRHVQVCAKKWLGFCSCGQLKEV